MCLDEKVSTQPNLVLSDKRLLDVKKYAFDPNFKHIILGISASVQREDGI